MSDIPDFEEKRKSVRLVGSLAVEMVLPGVSKAQHGYTFDINHEGLGVEADYLDLEALNALIKGNLSADLVIDSSPEKKIRATCEMVWFHKDDELTEEKYLIGFKFLKIDPAELKLILSRARHQTKWLGVVVVGLVILLIIFLGYLLS